VATEKDSHRRGYNHIRSLPAAGSGYGQSPDPARDRIRGRSVYGLRGELVVKHDRLTVQLLRHPKGDARSQHGSHARRIPDLLF